MAKEFYNYDKVMSYNGTFNMVVGGRGIGKTYGAKEKAMSRFIKKGEQFIYLRRYKSELVAAKQTFFSDFAHLFEEYDMRVMGGTAQISHVSLRADKKREWQTAGYFIALSTSQAQKSVAFPKVTVIIFDEFIIEKGANRYLTDEVTVFTNFYSTVDRYMDKTRVLFLANSVSIMNPYFLDYGIRPDEESEFVIPRKFNGFIVCHFPESKAFTTAIYQTNFGRFIKDTEYGDYAAGNEFSDNTDSLIRLKDMNASYLYTLETSKGAFSVWHDDNGEDYFVQAKRPKQEILFTLVTEKMGEEKTLVTVSDRLIARLRGAFRSGKMRFDQPSTRNAFIEIFRR